MTASATSRRRRRTPNAKPPAAVARLEASARQAAELIERYPHLAETIGPVFDRLVTELEAAQAATSAAPSAASAAAAYLAKARAKAAA